MAPFYEFTCLVCKIYFELGTEVELNIKDISCVECRSRNIVLQRYNKDLGLRIENLSNDIKGCLDRIDRLEDAVLDGVSDVRSNDFKDENNTDN